MGEYSYLQEKMLELEGQFLCFSKPPNYLGKSFITLRGAGTGLRECCRVAETSEARVSVPGY